jgi:CRISPR-associated protein Cmr1
MELHLKTLTPLWTGGFSEDNRPKMDQLYTTGLMGSLRWWYEMLVRGVGANACDPSNHLCNFDLEKYQNSNEKGIQHFSEAGICASCQMFGATGWKRRFRLETSGNELKPDSKIGQNGKVISIPNAGRPDSKWYLYPGKEGDFSISLYGEERDINIISDLLIFISRYGGLGARTQLGYGIIEPKNEININGALIEKLSEIKGSEATGNLPDIRYAFWGNIKFEKDPGIEETFRIKRDLRASFHKPGDDQNMRHDIFGKVYIGSVPNNRENRYGSTISMSRPYRVDDHWEIRLWGWIPAKYPGVIDRIYGYLRTTYSSQLSWKQFNSPNDVSNQSILDPVEFIRKLL